MPEDIFATQYKSLNKSQKEAVDTIEGPVMVVAGPGTGKTTVLTLRIANILRKTDTPANGILAITYTDAGVKAMRSKLENIIGDRAYDVRIHTFHSFASTIIAEYPDHFLHIHGMKMMTEVEQESLIRSILADAKFADLRPSGKPDVYIPGIIRAISDAKREAQTPSIVADFAKNEIERIKKDEDSISTRGASKGQLKAEAKELIAKYERTILFSEIYEKYDDLKHSAKKMDFNDLIIQLLTTLRNDELLLRLIQERFLYIHVDEHQDTNDAQNFIVALIAEFFETPNIFIVGDEKQAIYRFQGASVENFLLLNKRWPKMKTISLDTNYRSHQDILDTSFGMIENNYKEGENKNLRIRLKSGHKPEGNSIKSKDKSNKPVTIVTGENVSAIEQYLLKQLGYISKNEPKATVAIIVRRNRDLNRVIRLLESQHIAVASERSVDIFSHPVGRLFFNLIEYLSDPTKFDALAKTIIAGMWGFSFESASHIVRLISSGKQAEIDKKIPSLARIRERILSDSGVGFLIHAGHESGFVDLVAKDPSYTYVWRGIVALAESIVRDSSIHDPLELMKAMLSYRMSAESRPIKITVGAPELPILAMTAHGSKGLEFDYVFIPYVTEEAWIGRTKGASFILPKKQANTSETADIRRLFYVALTRARKQVNILTAKEESDGHVLTPLRFISELGTKNVHEISLSRADTPSIHIEQGAMKKELRLRFIHATKQRLLESGLSVTALNHFLECPSKFIYQSVLKLPQAPSIPAEKGTAMHEAISNVWKSKDRSAKEIESILIKSLTDFFDSSVLSLREKAEVLKELTENAPIVARALESHFTLSGRIFTEHWVEGVFKEKFENTDVSIPIHGKLDAIVDQDREVLVFDYKTRQALSVGAIRGETKNSNGEYFRQLVFYHLLLSMDAKFRNKKISPALVFVSPDDKDRCPIVSLPITEVDVTKLKGEIKSLVDSVWSGEIVDARCADEECEWCGIKALGLMEG